MVALGAMVCRSEGAVGLSWIGTGLETAAVGTGGRTICRGGSGTGAGVGGREVVTFVAVCAGAGVSALTTDAGRGRKVVWGTGGMVVVGIGAAVAGFAVLGLMRGSVAEATPVAVGGGAIGGTVLLSGGADAASPEAELTEGAG